VLYLFRAAVKIPTNIINNNNNYCIVTWRRENSTQESLTGIHITPRLRNLKIRPVIKWKYFTWYTLKYSVIKRYNKTVGLCRPNETIGLYTGTLLHCIFLLLNFLIYALYKSNFYSCKISRCSFSTYDSKSISRLVFLSAEMSKILC